MSAKKNFYTTKEAAQYLGVSHHTLINWRRPENQGKGPKFFYLHDKQCMYHLSHLDEWSEEKLQLAHN